MIHVPHLVSPNNSCSSNTDAALLSDATDRSAVARSHKQRSSQMSHKSYVKISLTPSTALQI
jgi:hypothetical protein